VRIRGRLYFKRSDIDRYKAALVAHALGTAAAERPIPDVDPLVSARNVGDEFGVGRRTIGRRLKDAQRIADRPPGVA
jgi:hypothetical protein